MSWDVSISTDECPTCKHSQHEEVRNVTYNNSKIFSALGVHPSFYVGKRGREVVEAIHNAIETSYKYEMMTELSKLEPPNGWGGIEDSRDFLIKLEQACIKYPEGTIHVN